MAASPAPFLVELVVEPVAAADQDALLAALEALVAKARLEYVHDAKSRRITLRASDEATLDAAVGALRDGAGLSLRLGALSVAYRETLARRIEIDATHKRHGDDGYEFARVRILFTPGDSTRYESRVEEGAFPPGLVAGVARGLETAMRAGALAGCPVVDVAAALVDGAWHPTDSSPATFEAAAAMALRLAQGEVGVLLEPIMQVEVEMAEPYVGVVRGDLLARRGEIGAATLHGAGRVALAGTVPLANLLGYPASLRTATHGSGTMAIQFSHFAPIDPPGPPRVPGAAALRVA